jgi:hypothetical protein
LAILARTTTRLLEETAEPLDQGLFAGTIKRSALKEAIKKELAQDETHEVITKES